MNNTLFDTDKGAEFSPCRTWRYSLWRRWSFDCAEKDQAVFIGLNPSTADETLDDPTIRRCIRFSKDWGYSSYLMLNAYGFRATKPKDMQAADDPVGPGNDAAIQQHCRGAGIIIAAWGVHCEPERERKVCELIGRTIHCLGLTKASRPRHPLYLRKDTQPQVFWSP